MTHRLAPSTVHPIAQLVRVISLVLSLGGVAAAMPGDLDLTFNGTGIVVTPIAAGGAEADAIVRQTDGKLVTAGSAYNGSNYDFAVVRYDTNGALDPSFGGTGIVTTDVLGGDDEGHAVIQQMDGKILVVGLSYDAGFSFSRVTLVRYDLAGILDTSFGGGTGKVTTQVGTGYDGALGVVQQTDGKLVVTGYTGGTDVVVIRYDLSGTPDPTFNSTGIVTRTAGALAVSGRAIVQQAGDGKLVVAGESDGSFLLLRYDGSGMPDTAFGGGTGMVTTPVGSGSGIARALIQVAGGRLVVAGSSSNGTDMDFTLARYGLDGMLDSNFGTLGVAITPIGSGDDDAYGLVQDADGNLVAAGSTDNGSNRDVALVRYTTGGTPDAAFGSGGMVVTPIGTGDDEGFAITTQPDGKLVVAGYSMNGASEQAVLRYLGSTVATTTTTTSPVSTTTTTLPPLPFKVDKLRVNLNFAHRGRDVILVNGSLRLPTGFVPTGQTVRADVGGATGSATLNRRSKGPGFIVRKSGKVQATLRHGGFADALKDEGLTNETVTARPVEIDVAIDLGGAHYEGTAHATYSAKAGKWGKAK